MRLLNLDAERMVLGRILLEPSLLDVVELKTDDFFSAAHQLLWLTFRELERQQKPLNLVQVMEELNRNDQLAQVGGSVAVAGLTDNCAVCEDVTPYVTILKELAALRRLHNTTLQIQSRIREGGQPSELLSEAEGAIMALSQEAAPSAPEPLSQVLSVYLDELAARDGRPVTGLPTGLTRLDRMLSGLQPGDLVILAARPSMGKTAFSLNMAVAAARSQTAVAIFNLEMNKGSLGQRLVSLNAQVDLGKLRTGNLSQQDWEQVIKASERLSELPLFLDDTPGLSLAELRSRARRIAAQRPLGLIVVDYLQLIKTERTRGGNREQEISALSRGLKLLARELKCPVMALSQLNRSLEYRQDKRPLMSDLRESGAIEQDADVILFLHREVVFTRDADRADELKYKAEIIVAKQRNGATGTVEAVFLPHLGAFANPASVELQARFGRDA